MATTGVFNFRRLKVGCDPANVFECYEQDTHTLEVHNARLLPQDLRDLQAKPSRLVRATFNPKAAYLLVGGLGGLGRAVSLWMAERGARHLTYLSRSAGDSVWATSADFTVDPKEIQAVVAAYNDKGDVKQFQSTGLYIAGERA